MTIRQTRQIRRTRRTAIQLLSTIGLLLCAPALVAAETSDLVFIVNSGNPTSTLSLAEVRDIYRVRKQHWDTGGRIRFVLPEFDTPTMQTLATRVFGMRSVDSVRRFYLSALFQLTISEMPHAMPTDATIALVRKDKGAIALVPKSRAEAARGVKSLRVDGW